MKKILNLSLSIFLFLFVSAPFVEVLGYFTDHSSNGGQPIVVNDQDRDAFLREYGLSLAWVMEFFGGEMDGYGAYIPTLEDWENGSWDDFPFMPGIGPGKDQYTGQYLSSNGISVIQSWNYDPNEIFFSYDGFNRFMYGEEVYRDEFIPGDPEWDLTACVLDMLAEINGLPYIPYEELYPPTDPGGNESGGNGDGGGEIISTYTGAEQPINPQDGETWFNTTDRTQYTYDGIGGRWVGSNGAIRLVNVPSAQNFVMETNSYNGVKYRITGHRNAPPVIERIAN